MKLFLSYKKSLKSFDISIKMSFLQLKFFFLTRSTFVQTLTNIESGLLIKSSYIGYLNFYLATTLSLHNCTHCYHFSFKCACRTCHQLH